MNLKSMKIDALVDLRSRIDAVLASKVSDERRALESEDAASVAATRFASCATNWAVRIRVSSTSLWCPGSPPRRN